MAHSQKSRVSGIKDPTPPTHSPYECNLMPSLARVHFSYSQTIHETFFSWRDMSFTSLWLVWYLLWCWSWERHDLDDGKNYGLMIYGIVKIVANLSCLGWNVWVELALAVYWKGSMETRPLNNWVYIFNLNMYREQLLIRVVRRGT